MTDAARIAEKLTPAQRKILIELVCQDECFNCMHFKAISSATDLPVADIRIAVRAMASEGLAYFATGLFTEDGEPYGSGYGATDLGRAVAAELGDG